jgi:hypothetical protein
MQLGEWAETTARELLKDHYLERRDSPYIS